MERKIAFLADVHLKRHDRVRAGIFLRALRSLYADCSHIYILGDLFEFWVGSAHSTYKDYRFVLDSMETILDGSTPVTVLHGNRDYLLGDHFPVGRNVKVVWDPIPIRLGKLRVCLCHGDLLLTRDKSYRFVRWLFHNRMMVRFNEMLPPSFSYYYTHGYRNHSKRSVRRKMRTAEHVLDISPQAVTGIFEDRFDVIVSAHVHDEAARYFARTRSGKPWSEVPTPDRADGILYTLGEWRDTAPVLIYRAGRFAFRNLAIEGA